MAKYLVEFKVGIIVDEPFEVGDEGDVIEDLLTTEEWNKIVNNAIDTLDTSDLSGNVFQICREYDE